MKMGFLDEYTKSMPAEREAEVRSREEVQNVERGNLEDLSDIRFWNAASDFFANKLGYSSPMEAQEESPLDAEIWANLVAKAIDMRKEGEDNLP